MRSFISACNIDEILYNIDEPGHLNPYTIGNPVYFPMNRFNIFTSIPLVPENLGSDGESDFWRFLGSVVRFVGGGIITVGGAILTYTSAPLLLVPGLSIIPQFGITMTIYGASMMASSWDSQIKEDMDRIWWNSFNSNEDAVLKSDYVSFYKGSAVIRHSIPDKTSCSIGGVIFLNRNTSSVMDLKHEWGHSVQSWLLGALYIPLIAIPSLINYQRDLEDKLKHDYYWYPWESTADWLGGVVR
jgi:hypothetical protein